MNTIKDMNTEHTLSRFRLKGPAGSVRTRVLAAGHVAWNQPPEAGKIVRPDWGWRWVGWCAAAAAFLILLNGVVTSLDEHWQSGLFASQASEPACEETAYEQLCVELGRDPIFAHQFRLLAAAAIPVPDLQNFFNQRNALFQSQGLINGGRS